MSYNGSGVFSVLFSFTPGTTILASQTNANNADFALGFSSVLTRDNQAPMTAPLRLADGSQPLPGLQFANDTNTGLRRSAVDELRAVTGGVDAMMWDAAQKTWALGALDAAGLANFQAAVTMLAGLTLKGTGSLEEFVGQRFSNAQFSPAGLILDKSRNASVGAHTIVQNGDMLGQVLFRGSDGTNFEPAAQVYGVVDGTPGVDDMPGAVILATTPDGAVLPVERMAIRADGTVQIPNRAAPLIQLRPGGFIDLTEIATPAAPAANVLRPFALDVGGATKLALEDSTGLVTVLGPGELVAIIEDRKAQNTPGGTFTSGADQTRALTTLVFSRNALVSLAANQFTLPAGDWEIEWSAPAFQVDNHQTLLRNVTDAADVVRGSSALTNNALLIVTRSVGSARVTITASKAFEIRHRCGTTKATDGFGQACNLGPGEVYTLVVVRRA